MYEFCIAFFWYYVVAKIVRNILFDSLCAIQHFLIMKFLRSWLEEYIDLTTVTNNELAHSITSHSSEVESVEEIRDYFQKKVVIGRIKNTRKHPNADRLQVFEVEIGEGEEVTIVSAAPNARDNILVPVALVGAVLPGITIAERAMRGVTSYGMCCGKSELLQEREFSEGLWELDCGEKHIGQSICATYPNLFPSDTLFEIKILPDRIGNIGNYLGLAIEIARITGRTAALKGLAQKVFTGTTIDSVPSLQPDQKSIIFEDSTGLSKVFDVFRTRLSAEYTLPLDIKRRLFLTKSHLVNPLADLSNYIMYVTGQPVHFFDTEAIFGEQNEVKWRFEAVSETTSFEGLGNLKSAQLPENTIVLKQNDAILTIPALTGGLGTKVEEKTRDVLIEIPYFDSNLTMRNAFLLKYRSEGSKIWASRSHPSRIPLAISLVVQELGTPSIILLSTEGSTQDRSWSSHSTYLCGQEIALQPDWNYLTQAFDHSSIEHIQSRFLPYILLLGSWNGKELLVNNLQYNFVEDQETLLTELTNLSGINDIASTVVHTQQIPPYRNEEYFAKNHLKNFLNQHGFDEVITRPFVETGVLKVLKSQNANMNFLRSKLWPTLLEVVSKNSAAGVEDIRIFELNRVFSAVSGKIAQPVCMCCVLNEDNPYQLTYLIQRLAIQFHHQWSSAQIDSQQTERGQEYTYSFGNQQFTLVELNNTTKKSYSLPLKKRWWIIEAQVDSLIATQFPVTYTDTSIYPSLTRDLNISVSPGRRWLDLHKIFDKLQLPFKITILPQDILTEENRSVITVRVAITDHDETPSQKHLEKFTDSLRAELSASGFAEITAE